MSKKKGKKKPQAELASVVLAPTDDWQSEARKMKWLEVDINALASILRVARGKIVSVKIDPRIITITETVVFTFVGTGVDGAPHENVYTRDHTWTWKKSYETANLIASAPAEEPVRADNRRENVMERVPCLCPVLRGKYWLHERNCPVGEYQRLTRIDRQIRELEERRAEDRAATPTDSRLEGESQFAPKKQLSLF